MNLLDDFASRAKKYLAEKDDQPVYPHASAIEALQHLNSPLQEGSIDASTVLALLDEYGSPATVKTTGGRYFGFVTGSSLQAAMSAKLLATVWDQNGALSIMSPVASLLEEISSNWLVSLLCLPEDTVTAFVTGATMANFTGLAAARHALLKKQGWDVQSQGLFHAPEITVIAGDELHVSLLKALSMLGFGRDRIIRVPVDAQGRMIAEKIPAINGPTIVCAQSGNVNSGAFDPLEEIYDRVKNENTWIHVDGAFGLWAAASPEKKHLMKGIELADSWATDAHKWLNVPYDSGFAFVKNKQILFEAMSATAAYLPEISMRESFQYVPEMSRQARGIAVWAALKSLGKKGLAELIEKNCRQAKRFAEGLQQAGFLILNEVELNQVLVNFGDAETTNNIIKKIQEDGTCWCGGTTWHGKAAMRISVSSYATTDDDVERSLAVMIKLAKQ
ncbi:MAG TPA: pyridoxal-dependent decarboxylase [Puia sp.]|nr:pyridoxal-dependent decarboxylase [Puia sp.]